MEISRIRILNKKMKIFFIISLIFINFSSVISIEENEVLTGDDVKRNIIVNGCTNLVHSRLNNDPVKKLIFIFSIQ